VERGVEDPDLQEAGEEALRDPDADEVLFDLFPPTGEPDLRIAYADLPDVMTGYDEYLAIIQAKISEVEGL
jgi:hypothetical protein